MSVAIMFAILAILFVVRRVPWDDDSPKCQRARGPPRG